MPKTATGWAKFAIAIVAVIYVVKKVPAINQYVQL